MRVRRSLLFIALLFALADGSGLSQVNGYLPPADWGKLPRISQKVAKNLVLCIGDGMGFAQVSAARITGAGADGLLHMETMPITGVVKTHSANRLITDSAAGATAYASGQKTNNRMIRVAPDSATILPSILELCQKTGKSVGLVATSSITHATPAAFGAHVISRNDQSEIAWQLIENRIDVLMGGGLGFFLPQSNPLSLRQDEVDLLSLARSWGYQIVVSGEQLTGIKTTPLLALFAPDGMTTHPPEPSIQEMTQKAIELLSADRDGFFLMVEGSQIDWACHDNDAPEAIRQMLLFDMAVKEILDFARKDGKTLVLVTADHETGGMTIDGGEKDGKDLNIHFSREGHTAVVVPLYAFGPGAELFTGVHDNTDLFHLMVQALNLQSGRGEGQ